MNMLIKIIPVIIRLMRSGQVLEDLEKLTTKLFQSIKKRLGDKVESLTLVGSYATGTFSLQRPDINFHIIFKETAGAKEQLIFGEILSNIVHKFENKFTIRLEYRPFKFPSPYGKMDRFEIFLNPIVNNVRDIYGDYPLNMPKNVLAGMKKTSKVVFGKDILVKIPTDIDKAYVIKTSFRDLGIFRTQLKYAALSYDLTNPSPELMNEAVCLGKMMLRLGLEIASTNKEIKSGSYIYFFKDMKKIEKFYEKRYGKNAAKAAKIILDAREKYNEWKRNKKMIYQVYKAAYKIGEISWQKLLVSAKSNKC